MAAVTGPTVRYSSPGLCGWYLGFCGIISLCADMLLTPGLCGYTMIRHHDTRMEHLKVWMGGT